MVADGPPFRLLPVIDDENRFYWTGGEDGHLRFQHCEPCDRFIHPPAPRCPFCFGPRPRPQPVSGRAEVVSFTVNHQQWIPGAEPYVVAWVAIEEQDDIRLTTNLVGVEPDQIRIGMPVEVLFEQHEDVFLPVFGPVSR
jgi:uncharacterized OB-fold protein